MQFNPDAIGAMYYSFSKLYQQGFDSAEPWWQRIATEVPSTTRENRYPWMAALPRMREWVGERILRNVAARSTALVNKDWEDTVEIDRNDIDDDQLGIYSPTLQMLGYQARRWPDDMLLTVLQSSTLTAFDGQPFFNASHPVNVDNANAGTFSNLFANTALTPANYNTVRASMRNVVGEDGRPMALNPNLLVVPPQLEMTAKQIVQAEMIAPVGAFGINAASGMQTNVLRGSAEVLVIPELSNDPTTWYLLDVSKPIKPFIVQIRKPPQLVSLTDPTTENVFMRKKFIYGVDSRGNAGLGLPFLAAKATA